MTPLNEAEVDDLLGAYALGALAASDRERVEEHLAGCQRHAADAANLVRVTSTLALTVADRDPSPELRGRILDAIRAEEPSAAAPLVRPVGAAGAKVRRWTSWLQQPRSAILAAAAIVMLVLGIAIGRLTAPPGSVAHVTTWTFRGTAQAPNTVARIAYFADDHRAVAEVSGLKPLNPGQVYELWLFKGSTPVDAGVGLAPNGSIVVQLGDLRQYSEIAITVEPGEQPKPTGTPILAGKLS